MSISYDIERLLSYAEINLLMDEADKVYVRNVLMQKIGLTEWENSEVDEDELETVTLDELLDPLYAYAEKNGCASDRKKFVAAVMGIVSLRPGEMKDMFESLSAHPAKALEWAFDYAVKNGYAVSGFRRWENKGDKNIDVVFADCGQVSSSKYPQCDRCISCEGYGENANARFINLDIGDGSWYYKAAAKAYYGDMGEVVSSHEPLVMNEETLNAMFDFVEFAPSYYACALDGGSHKHFKCGTRLLPAHKSADVRKLKNADYPYIGITQTDWYLNMLRLSCTNRAKLVEFASNVIKKHGKTLVSVRKVANKFVVEIILISDKQPKADRKVFVGGSVGAFDMLGVFRIDDKMEESLEAIKGILTKDVKYSQTALGKAENYAKMVASLVKETGDAKLGDVEAALDIKEETKKNFVACLTDVRAYDDKTIEELYKQLQLQ